MALNDYFVDLLTTKLQAEVSHHDDSQPEANLISDSKGDKKTSKVVTPRELCLGQLKSKSQRRLLCVFDDNCNNNTSGENSPSATSSTTSSRSGEVDEVTQRLRNSSPRGAPILDVDVAVDESLLVVPPFVFDAPPPQRDIRRRKSKASYDEEVPLNDSIPRSPQQESKASDAYRDEEVPLNDSSARSPQQESKDSDVYHDEEVPLNDSSARSPQEPKTRAGTLSRRNSREENYLCTPNEEFLIESASALMSPGNRPDARKSHSSKQRKEGSKRSRESTSKSSSRSHHSRSSERDGGSSIRRSSHRDPDGRRRSHDSVTLSSSSKKKTDRTSRSSSQDRALERRSSSKPDDDRRFSSSSFEERALRSSSREPHIHQSSPSKTSRSESSHRGSRASRSSTGTTTPSRRPSPQPQSDLVDHDEGSKRRPSSRSRRSSSRRESSTRKSKSPSASARRKRRSIHTTVKSSASEEERSTSPYSGMSAVKEKAKHKPSAIQPDDDISVASSMDSTAGLKESPFLTPSLVSASSLCHSPKKSSRTAHTSPSVKLATTANPSRSSHASIAPKEHGNISPRSLTGHGEPRQRRQRQAPPRTKSLEWDELIVPLNDANSYHSSPDLDLGLPPTPSSHLKKMIPKEPKAHSALASFKRLWDNATEVHDGSAIHVLDRTHSSLPCSPEPIKMQHGRRNSQDKPQKRLETLLDRSRRQNSLAEPSVCSLPEPSFPSPKSQAAPSRVERDRFGRRSVGQQQNDIETLLNTPVSKRPSRRADSSVCSSPEPGLARAILHEPSRAAELQKDDGSTSSISLSPPVSPTKSSEHSRTRLESPEGSSMFQRMYRRPSRLMRSMSPGGRRHHGTLASVSPSPDYDQSPSKIQRSGKSSQQQSLHLPMLDTSTSDHDPSSFEMEDGSMDSLIPTDNDAGFLQLFFPSESPQQKEQEVQIIQVTVGGSITGGPESSISAELSEEQYQQLSLSSTAERPCPSTPGGTKASTKQVGIFKRLSRSSPKIGRKPLLPPLAPTSRHIP